MILVSSCLLGKPCRYDGKSSRDEATIEYLKGKKYIEVCPEVLGGLNTPRDPAEIQIIDDEVRIINCKGIDVTKEFFKGAEEVLKIAKENNCTKAILKAKSPSCGCGKIYDGSFSGKLIEGNGVTADLLIKEGIKVQSAAE